MQQRWNNVNRVIYITLGKCTLLLSKTDVQDSEKKTQTEQNWLPSTATNI